MADGNPLNQQPDFNLISNEFNLIGDELKKAQNLPAITNGQQILNELRDLRQDIADTRRDLRQDIGDTRRDLISMMTASYV